MRRTRPTGRRAFTLVELLIVISLIAVLAALSAGTLFRVRESQNSSITEKTLDKLHSMLDTRWKVVLQDAVKTVPEPLVTSCGGDRKRALVVWTHAKLKNEFPQTFSEVRHPMSPPNPLVSPPNPMLATPGSDVTTTLGAALAPRAVFKAAVPSTYLVDAESQILQSAALLYITLTQTGGGGNAMTLEGIQQQIATDPTSGLSYFKDGWGKPIVMVRHATNAEINAAAKASQVRKAAGTVSVLSIFDPEGMMIAEDAWRQNPANLSTFDTIVRQLNTGLPSTSSPGLYNPPVANALVGATVTFARDRNLLPTLVSAGPNNDFGDLLGGDDDGADNILSFRTRREGSRGN